MAVKDGEATKKRRKRPYNVSFATFPKKLEMTLPAQLQKHDDKQTRQPKTRLPDRETTMPVKDGEATPKKSLTSPLKPFRKSASTVAKNTRRKAGTAAQNIAPGQGNTMLVKDGEVTKKRWKSP